MKRLISILLTLVLVSAAAVSLADSISFNGTVTADRTVEVYAPIGGTVADVAVKAGEAVTADTVLCSLKTTKVYASEAGTVTGIFGEPGDSAETVTSRYGAVMYIEGADKYTVSASTDNAYNSTATKFVHVGEQVYLVYRKDTDVTGTGVITAISGTSYTVEVEDGSFLLGASVDIYRDVDHTASLRVGRGTIARKNPTAVTGSGSIVSIAVKDGDTVQRGDLLFETLDGSFDGLYMSGKDIYADVEGVISSLNVAQGSAVQKDGVVAVIYPYDAMRIEGSIPETSLADIKTGDKVEIELNWNEDSGKTYEGTVSMISSLASSQNQTGSTAYYTVYIDFTPDEDTRYGMTATISTPED